MNNLNTFNPQLLTTAKQWLFAGFLLVILLVTRSEYVSHFQDASWAVFFLVGFYLRSSIGLPLLIIAAVSIDFAQIAAQGGHQDFYLSPSYLFIIPAYSILWFAGRFFANRYSENIKGLLTFIASAIIGIIACDLISSGGFYWVSSSSVDLSMNEFFSRTVDFLPISLKTNLLYLGIAALIHIGIVQATKLSSNQSKQST